MNRRRFLGTLGGGFTCVSAGCISDNGFEQQSSNTPTAERIARRGSPDDICNRSIRPSVQIKAIDDPIFGPASSAFETRDRYKDLSESSTVIGLNRSSGTQAYPLSVIAPHEIVNARLEIPLMVTYCPLCRSAIVADRRINGGAKTFQVSGLLWKPPDGTISKGVSGADLEGPSGTVDRDANLVMYDEETGSYWSQLLAAAICGPLTGQSLRLVPFKITTLGDWLDVHPNTEVLLPPPESQS